MPPRLIFLMVGAVAVVILVLSIGCLVVFWGERLLLQYQIEGWPHT
jgi:hypothetical protein